MCVYATLIHQPGSFYSQLHVAPKSQGSAWKGGSLHPHQSIAQVSTPTGLALLQNGDQSYGYIVVCPTWTFDTMYLFCFPLNMVMHHRMKLIGWNIANLSTATAWLWYIKIKKSKEKKTQAEDLVLWFLSTNEKCDKTTLCYRTVESNLQSFKFQVEI